MGDRNMKFLVFPTAEKADERNAEEVRNQRPKSAPGDVTSAWWSTSRDKRTGQVALVIPDEDAANLPLLERAKLIDEADARAAGWDDAPERAV